MIDILMATYNGEKYLREQLDSILNQTYKETHIIVRDDGSTDNTLDILIEYSNQFPNKITLVQDNVKCGSAVSNFFELTKYAKAEYVMYSDQDDYWLPNKIEKEYCKIKELEKKYGSEKPILVFANYENVDENLNVIETLNNKSQISKYKLKFNNLIVQNYINGCLTIMNKSLYMLMGEYDKSILMHDWWSALISSSLGVIYHLDEKLMYYRQHGNNVVGTVNVKSFKYRLKKFLDHNTKYMQYKYRDQLIVFRKRYYELLDEENKKIIDEYINVFEKHNKLARIRILIKGRYLKSDLIRIIGQIWYI